jgi:hypothetical protein
VAGAGAEVQIISSDGVSWWRAIYSRSAHDTERTA